MLTLNRQVSESNGIGGKLVNNRHISYSASMNYEKAKKDMFLSLCYEYTFWYFVQKHRHNSIPRLDDHQ